MTSNATKAIEYRDGVIDLSDGEDVIDTLRPENGEGRTELLARVGLEDAGEPDRWVDTAEGKASEFSVRPIGWDATVIWDRDHAAAAADWEGVPLGTVTIVR